MFFGVTTDTFTFVSPVSVQDTLSIITARVWVAWILYKYSDWQDKSEVVNGRGTDNTMLKRKKVKMTNNDLQSNVQKNKD